MERRGQARGRGEGGDRDGNRCVQRSVGAVPARVALVAGRLRSLLTLSDAEAAGSAASLSTAVRSLPSRASDRAPVLARRRSRTTGGGTRAMRSALGARGNA